MDSIEGLFDRSSEDAIRAEWNKLREAGLPSLADHKGATNRPHVTFIAARKIPGEVADTVAARLRASGTSDAPVPLRAGFGGLLLFGSAPRWILVRPLVVDRPLLELHERIHAAIQHAPAELDSASATASPGAWTPHVTLSSRLTTSQVAEALDLLAPPGPRPDNRAARIESVRFWDATAKTVRSLTD